MTEHVEERARQQGLDEVSAKAIRRLEKILSAREDMERAHRPFGRIPRGRVVQALLEAAYEETKKSFRLVLDKEKTRAKRASQTWVREVLDDPDTVIFDSETTGLIDPIDFLEIGVIDRDGNTLFDSRIRPICYVTEFEMVDDDEENPPKFGAPQTAEEKLATEIKYRGGHAAKTDTFRDDGTRIRRVRREPVSCDEGALQVHGIHPDDLRAAPSFAQVYPDLVAALKGKRVVVYNTAYDGRVWAQTVERYRLDPSGIDPGEWGCAMKAYAGYVGEYRYFDDQYREREPYPKSFYWQRLGGEHRALGDCRATLKRLHKMAGREVPELPEMPPVNPIPHRVLYPPPGYERNFEVTDEDFESIPF